MSSKLNIEEVTLQTSKSLPPSPEAEQSRYGPAPIQGRKTRINEQDDPLEGIFGGHIKYAQSYECFATEMQNM